MAMVHRKDLEKLHPGSMWYDDRQQAEPAVDAAVEAMDLWRMEPDGDNTPKEIYESLDRLVWKQEAAKKAAAIIAYVSFYRRARTNALFIGPTGCGKTYIWRCMKQMYPGRVVIADGSNITQDGWKGDKKWSTLFHDPALRLGEPVILVVDEADKMLMPKTTSAYENTSLSIQAEALAMMEGMGIQVSSKGGTKMLPTSNISFVFCGAFSSKADSIARKESGASIGFGAGSGKLDPYHRPLGTEDLVEYGVLPEFLGRISQVVNLEPMTERDFYDILVGSCSPAREIGERHGVTIRITEATARRLARDAWEDKLGVRGVGGKIQEMLYERMFEDPERQHYVF